jgi:hypothetical protein
VRMDIFGYSENDILSMNEEEVVDLAKNKGK